MKKFICLLLGIFIGAAGISFGNGATVQRKDGTAVSTTGAAQSPQFINLDAVGQTMPIGISFSDSYRNDAGALVSSNVAPQSSAANWREYR